MKIEELKNDLKEIQRKGYKIDIDKTIEENLKEHINRCIERYNTLKVEYDQVFNMRKDGKYKDFNELENEIKMFFDQYDQQDKLNQLIQKIHWNLIDYYHANKKDKEMMDKAEKRIILHLSSDKVVFKGYINKSRYDDSWEFSYSWELKRNMKEFFKLLLGIDIELPYLKYTMKDADFKTHTDGGFKVTVYKNGKIEFKGTPNLIRRINDAVKKYYQQNSKNILIMG